MYYNYYVRYVITASNDIKTIVMRCSTTQTRVLYIYFYLLATGIEKNHVRRLNKPLSNYDSQTGNSKQTF